VKGKNCIRGNRGKKNRALHEKWGEGEIKVLAEKGSHIRKTKMGGRLSARSTTRLTAKS